MDGVGTFALALLPPPEVGAVRRSNIEGGRGRKSFSMISSSLSIMAERRNVLASKASLFRERRRRRKNETTSPTTNSPPATPAMIPMMEPTPKPCVGFGTVELVEDTLAALAVRGREGDGDWTGTLAGREGDKRGVED